MKKQTKNNNNNEQCGRIAPCLIKKKWSSNRPSRTFLMRSYWVLPSFSFAAAIKKKHNEEATIRSILAEIAERIPSKIQTIHLSSSETINRLRNDTISWSSQLKNSNQSNRVFRPVQVGEDWNWSKKNGTSLKIEIRFETTIEPNWITGFYWVFFERVA